MINLNKKRFYIFLHFLVVTPWATYLYPERGEVDSEACKEVLKVHMEVGGEELEVDQVEVDFIEFLSKVPPPSEVRLSIHVEHTLQLERRVHRLVLVTTSATSIF